MLGLDIGDRRIGVALSDPGAVLATPYMIIDRDKEPDTIKAIYDITCEQEVAVIVVGLPCRMSGDIGEQAAKVLEFVEQLQQQTDAPIELRDERLSTVSARQLLQEGRGRKSRGKTRYDAAAAAVILQAFLDEGR